jgi:hypothetical protein
MHTQQTEESQLSRSLAKTLPIQPPQELIAFLDDPALVGDETREAYHSVLTAIVTAEEPADAIVWVYIKCFVDLTWEHHREHSIKAGIVKLKQKEVVQELLKITREEPTALESNLYRVFNAADEANKWSVDPVARREIDERLAAKGYSTQEVLARAYMKGANQIDAVDRRIASYEGRRMLMLREIERRNDKLARRPDKASFEIIEAEFSEAA